MEERPSLYKNIKSGTITPAKIRNVTATIA